MFRLPFLGEEGVGWRAFSLSHAPRRNPSAPNRCNSVCAQDNRRPPSRYHRGRPAWSNSLWLSKTNRFSTCAPRKDNNHIPSVAGVHISHTCVSCRDPTTRMGVKTAPRRCTSALTCYRGACMQVSFSHSSTAACRSRNCSLCRNYVQQGCARSTSLHTKSKVPPTESS